LPHHNVRTVKSGSQQEQYSSLQIPWGVYYNEAEYRVNRFSCFLVHVGMKLTNIHGNSCIDYNLKTRRICRPYGSKHIYALLSKLGERLYSLGMQHVNQQIIVAFHHQTFLKYLFCVYPDLCISISLYLSIYTTSFWTGYR
jgi:hypothetical protein